MSSSGSKRNIETLDLSSLQKELEEAEEVATKKRKIVEDAQLVETDRWYANTDNLKQFLIKGNDRLSFVGVENGRLIYSLPYVAINNEKGSYTYRIYSVTCKLLPDNSIFTSTPLPHTYLCPSDKLIDHLEFKFIKHYYDNYY